MSGKEAKKKHAICPIEGCDANGFLSLTQELKICSTTIDDPLLFCDAHFPLMCELYSIYKGLEDMRGFMCLFCDESWWRRIKREDNNSDFLYDLHHAAELALSLRCRFQASLKEEISKHGHEYYMAQLLESIGRLNEFLETGGEEWHYVSRRRRHRSRAGIRRYGRLPRGPTE